MCRVLLGAIALTLVTLAVSANCSLAFELERYLEHYSEEDGLLTDRVPWVRIATDGTKWFGHTTPEYGVTRFDGLNWESFRLNFANSIVDMTLDPYGRVWTVLVHMPCFAYLDNGEFHRIPTAYPTIKCGTAIMFDPEGSLWGGGWGGGAVRGDIPFVGRSRNDGISWTFWETATFPWAFDVDLQGRVWFAGQYGVYRQTPGGEKWERAHVDVDMQYQYDYRNIFISGSGRVWLSRAPLSDLYPVTILYSDDYPDYASWTRLEFPESLESGVTGFAPIQDDGT